MDVKSRPWITFSTSRSFSSATRASSSQIVTVAVTLPDQVGAELLERCVGIHRLVVGIRIEQCRGLVGHHLLEDRHDRLALGEPLAADTGEDLGGVSLVERNSACAPAVWECQPIELVEDPGIGG